MPAVPYYVPGYPTVYAWGPFPDHEPVSYADLETEYNGLPEEE